MSLHPRFAVVQVCSRSSWADNWERCRRLGERAREAGARLIAFPETVPYLGPPEGRASVVQGLDGEVAEAFRGLARELGAAVLLGSMFEAGPEGRCYNTSVLFDEQGARVASYRKIHLFDVDLPDGSRFRESDTFAPGAEVVVAEVCGVKVGLTVCYDLRFPELFRALVGQGAQVIFVPSAFTARTGRDHWEILLRARAIEDQVYIVAPNQWGTHMPGRESYGRSMIVEPWGSVVAQVPDGEGFALAEIDLGRVAQVRAQIPCLQHRRISS